MWGMLIRLILVLALATLAACGGGQKPSAASDAGRRKALLDFAACMRKHGVPMQDPKFTTGGGTAFSVRGRVSPQTQRAAQQACGRLAKAAQGPPPSAADQAKFRERALAQARCMRAHGVPSFPDPQFGDNGQATLSIKRGAGIDPNDPAFQRAQRICMKGMQVAGG
jgi:hypothetical protein